MDRVFERELRAFLCSVTYLERHFPRFASGVAADLLKQKAEFVWNEEREQEFQSIKRSVTGRVLLAAPADVGEFVLTSDLSDAATGAMIRW
ncbi:hypothetical protein GNI_061140 [Gregarina niphandrodes]|uniref:Reverse transcriptase/retrotransposon-derived protein RNase H-like domain-containing protein n=1 Tax=Gregarina niphandrodes TaxID=110365 RepID=A0A023B899_GRENI|nr:hypothetical protein GNI_061140 [Gregarina niphandrodes]EZG68846.1 hypothetical protein GNI_061140 [Gregarina niphandrodes]|eukprot:XP_011134540.1 hypothetical protein GNI_061140 [Gregarina niphandrodes]